MRRGWIPLMIVVAVTGCGAKSTSSHSASSSTPTATSTPTITTPATTAAHPECNRVGINPKRMREGTCNHGGITYVIVNQNHSLPLRTLAARLNSIRSSGGLVTASLTVTNKLSSSRAFDAGGTQQTALILGGRVYKEDVSAETGVASSCVRHNGSPLARAASQQCEVIFQVPSPAAALIGKHGAGDLYVVNFGDNLIGDHPPTTVGAIRLYR